MIERFNARNAFLKPFAVLILPPVESVCNSNKGFKFENLQPVFMRGSELIKNDSGVMGLVLIVIFKLHVFFFVVKQD